MLIECPYCHEKHDIEALEPSFLRSDVFLALAASDGMQVREAKGLCAIRPLDDSWRRYFLRVLIPFSVEGLAQPISWGAWVEVTEKQFDKLNELWDDPTRMNEPPFEARLTNELPGYQDSFYIVGVVSFTNLTSIPEFSMTSPIQHPFVMEQQKGITLKRAGEWMIPIYHPESRTQSAIQERIDTNKNQKRWWQFWQ